MHKDKNPFFKEELAKLNKERHKIDTSTFLETINRFTAEEELQEWRKKYIEISRERSKKPDMLIERVEANKTSTLYNNIQRLKLLSPFRWVSKSLGYRNEAEIDAANSIVERPPLSFWVSTLQFVFPKKVFANIFAQTIADARDDHAEALAKQQNRLASWIEIRSHIQILTTLILYVFVNIGKKVAALWKIG